MCEIHIEIMYCRTERIPQNIVYVTKDQFSNRLSYFCFVFCSHVSDKVRISSPSYLFHMCVKKLCTYCQ